MEIEKELTQLEWYEFLRKWLKIAGVEDKKVVFLITDSQINDDKYFEDINNLLNIGEIPNLYAGEDKENVNIQIIAGKNELNSLLFTIVDR